MLVMDVDFKVMERMMAEVMGSRTIFVSEHSTHWEFYIDHSENIVLRSRMDKKGGELDAMFLATIPKARTIRVQAITWGKHVAITSLLQETRDSSGHAVDDIAPDVPESPEVEAERGGGPPIQ